VGGPKGRHADTRHRREPCRRRVASDQGRRRHLPARGPAARGKRRQRPSRGSTSGGIPTGQPTHNLAPGTSRDLDPAVHEGALSVARALPARKAPLVVRAVLVPGAPPAVAVSPVRSSLAGAARSSSRRNASTAT
jgi:hypothetical protein